MITAGGGRAVHDIKRTFANVRFAPIVLIKSALVRAAVH
jgi:hypothetical protein